MDKIKTKLPTIEEIKRIVTPIAKKYGVERVFVFGSYARGDATPESDVDFRIDRGAISTLFELGGFYSDVEEALSMPIDVLTTKSLDADFLNIIAKEEIMIYEQYS
ncbi:MAG: nucleotidyltransferase domain-containing protein [Deltaproteobacteria bacterium]|nr:nucleotidyltransferase domain-containing protein [Deltaproteobacteria bacterium]